MTKVTERKLVSFDWAVKKLLRSKANFDDVAKSSLDEWIYLLKKSAIKSDFKAKGIQKAGKVLDKMKMSKEDRAIYNRFIDNKRVALDQYQTAEMKGERRGRKKERQIQEAKMKRLEAKHSKELQAKEEKHSKELQAMAKMLFDKGFTKEEILAQTGVKLG